MKNLLWLLLGLAVMLPLETMAKDNFYVIPTGPSKSTSVGLNTAELNTTTRTNYSDKGTSYGSQVSEVITVSCNNDELITGGSCSSQSDDNDSSTTNWGVLHSCTIAGNSIIGSAYADALVYDANKFGPAITVYAICAKVSNTLTKMSDKDTYALEDAIAKMQEEMEERQRISDSKVQ